MPTALLGDLPVPRFSTILVATCLQLWFQLHVINWPSQNMLAATLTHFCPASEALKNSGESSPDILSLTSFADMTLYLTKSNFKKEGPVLAYSLNV